MRGRPLLGLIATVACGCNLYDYVEPSGPFVLRLPVPGGTDLALVSDGNTPWQRVRPGDDGIALVEIFSEFYGFAVVCPLTGIPAGFPPGKQVVVRYLAAGEIAARDPCTGSLVEVPIAIAQVPYTVLVFAADAIATDGSTLRVPAGIWDLGVIAQAFGADPRRLLTIERDVELRGGGGTLTVEPLARASDLLPLSPVTIEVDGADDEVLVHAVLDLESGTRVLLGEAVPNDATQRMIPAPGVLLGDDRLLMRVSSTRSDPSSSRSHQRPIADGARPGTFQLPAHADASFDLDGARWTGDWETARVFLGYSSAAMPPAMHVTQVETIATRDWRELAGVGDSLPRLDPTMLPDWDPSWAPPPTWLGWSLELWNGGADAEMLKVEIGNGMPL